jgi:hypothetical protein
MTTDLISNIDCVFLWYYRLMAVIIFWPVVIGTHICFWRLLGQNLSPSTECPGSCHIMAMLEHSFSFSSYVRWERHVAAHPNLKSEVFNTENLLLIHKSLEPLDKVSFMCLWSMFALAFISEVYHWTYHVKVNTIKPSDTQLGPHIVSQIFKLSVAYIYN